MNELLFCHAEDLDRDHLLRLFMGYRARLLTESNDPNEDCPYPDDCSFYFKWMQGWKQADLDLNFG